MLSGIHGERFMVNAVYVMLKRDLYWWKKYWDWEGDAVGLVGWTGPRVLSAMVFEEWRVWRPFNLG
jgi:hypothetical protein